MSSRTNAPASYLDGLLQSAMSRRTFLAGAGGLSLGALLAACTPGSTQQGTKYETLNVAVGNLGTQIADPMYAYSHSAMYSPIALNIGEQLVRRGYNGQYTPALATGWAVSPDSMTWTFTLRQGVKMHDGSKFTSRDLQTAIQRVQSKSNVGDFVSNEGLVGAITKLDLIDDYHLAITTNAPYFRMLDDLPIPIATDYYNQVGEQQFRKQPVAAGPFKLASQNLNESMTLARFDDFWDSTRIANFKTLKLLILADESTRIAGLLSGSIDVVNGLSTVATQQVKNNGGDIKLISDPDSAMVYMLFAALNPLNPTPAKKSSPVHDVRVRQAMMYALDRVSIAKTVLGGEATPLATMDLPSTFGYDPANKPFPYDPNKAKQLLSEAGASGFAFTLVSKSSDQGLAQVQDLCQAMVSNWNDVGIKAKYQPMEAGLQATLQDSHTFDGGFIFTQQGVKLYDPTYEASHYWSAKSDNVSFDDPKLDDYNSRLLGTLDPAARAQIAKEYDDYMYSVVPGLGLFSLNVVNAIGPHVKEWIQQAGNGGAGPFWGLRSN